VRSPAAHWRARGEGYIDTAIKILICRRAGRAPAVHSGTSCSSTHVLPKLVQSIRYVRFTAARRYDHSVDRAADDQRACCFVGSLIFAGINDLCSRTIPYSACFLLTLAGADFSFSPAHPLGLLLAVPFFLASGFGRGGAVDTMLIAAASLSLGFYPGLMGLAAALLLFLLFALTDSICSVKRKNGRSRKATRWLRFSRSASSPHIS
jgi:hypothetical protein